MTSGKSPLGPVCVCTCLSLFSLLLCLYLTHSLMVLEISWAVISAFSLSLSPIAASIIIRIRTHTLQMWRRRREGKAAARSTTTTKINSQSRCRRLQPRPPHQTYTHTQHCCGFGALQYVPKGRGERENWQQHVRTYAIRIQSALRLTGRMKNTQCQEQKKSFLLSLPLSNTFSSSSSLSCVFPRPAVNQS